MSRPLARHLRFGLALSLLPLLFQQSLAQSVPDYPLSYLSDANCKPCLDTVKFLMVKRVFDIGIFLPEWNPVVSWDHCEAVEGIVAPYSAGYIGTHVSQEDFSAFHYTHDFGFNVIPDSGYHRLLARRTYTGHELDHPTGKPDTVLDHTLHVEWESGLGAGNDGNPCAEANRRGESCGFGSAGHRRRETIWNWPSMGDWVHCEGTWVWDRGHPPARTELHPLRMMATRRAMRAYVPATPGGTDSVAAIRLDLYASGDGGALQNNRPGQAPFVHKTRMSDRDYSFRVPLPKGPAGATLRFRMERQPGDSYPQEVQVEPDGDALRVLIPWRTVADTAVLARSLYAWWEQGGAAAEAKPLCYEVHFQKLHFSQRKDVLSRPEKVIWLDAGGQYFCLNEWIDAEDILWEGEAHTYRRDWDMDLRVKVYGMPGDRFRVHVGGWENDGISRAFGELLDPLMPCTAETKKAFHKHLWPATPFGLHGCLDDLIGEVHDFYTMGEIGDSLQVVQHSKGKENELEQCPGANTEQDDVFTIWYEVRLVELDKE